MIHKYKTHFFGQRGRTFCGIPLGNFPVTVVFGKVTCRQCMRHYFSLGGTITGRFFSQYIPGIQSPVPKTDLGRKIRKAPELSLGYNGAPIASSGDPYVELAKVIEPHPLTQALAGRLGFRHKMMRLDRTLTLGQPKRMSPASALTLPGSGWN